MKKIIDKNFSLISEIRFWNIVLALFAGVSGSLFASGYWLVDVYPIDSKRLLASAALIGFLLFIAYYFIFSWLRKVWAKQSIRQYLMFASWGIFMGGIIFFGGTSNWMGQKKYVSFFLPTHSLQIEVQPNTASVTLAINGIKTSIEYISYNTIHYQGWERRGNRLFLVNSEDNSLSWEGKSGEEIQIFFENTQSADIYIILDHNQTHVISSKDFIYKQALYVPLYASTEILILLGLLHFILLSYAFTLFIWEKGYLSKWQMAIFSSKEQKVTRHDWLIVFGLLLVAFLLRVFNLNVLPPYVDEYSHLNAAKEILSGVPFSQVYPRSLWITTLPIAFFFRLFGISVWSARLASVFFNTLAIIPLYFAGKKLNTSIAVTAGLLYATNPWVIAISRNIREYAYYPFYFYCILYAMFLFLEKIPLKFSIIDEWKKLFRRDLFLLILVLLFPLLYAGIDYTSTFRVILIAYISFFLLFISKLARKDTFYLIVGALIAAIVLGKTFILPLIKLSISPDLLYRISFFFGNPAQQWYYNRTSFFVSLFIVGAIGAGVLAYKKTELPLLVATLFMTYFLTLPPFLSHYTRPRYMFSIEIWYIPLLAIGIYAIYSFLHMQMKRWPSVLLVTFFVILSYNPIQTLLPTFWQNLSLPFYLSDTQVAITEEIYYDIEPAYDLVLQNIEPQDALVSTFFIEYVKFKGMPDFSDVYVYNYEEHLPSQILEFVQSHNTGWIVLDYLRKPADFPLHTIKMGNTQIDYLGKYGDFFVWRWKTVQSSDTY